MSGNAATTGKCGQGCSLNEEKPDLSECHKMEGERKGKEERKRFKMKANLSIMEQAFQRALWEKWIYLEWDFWGLGFIGMGIRKWVVEDEKWDLYVVKIKIYSLRGQ